MLSHLTEYLSPLNLKESHSEYVNHGAIVRSPSDSSASTYSELIRRGYKKVNKLCDTQQGELLEAFDAKEPHKKVIIKMVPKALHSARIAKQTDDGMTYFVATNILKEAVILNLLTVGNQSMCYIIQYKHFFYCHDFYYLVTEHLGNNCMNLKEFVQKAHELIRDGKLSIKHYLKVIKFIVWQMCVLLHWMHNDMKCCHLDLKLEHILLQNVEFSMDTENQSVLQRNVSIKLCDFGSAECFRSRGDATFECNKESSSFREIQYQSPLVLNEQTYDAQKADIWALGMIIARCVIGRPLYESVFDAGYGFLRRNCVKDYVLRCDLKKYVKKHMVDLLQNMLKINKNERYTVIDILKHKFFQSYYNKYKNQIEIESKSEKSTMSKNFPYYKRSRNRSTIY